MPTSVPQRRTFNVRDWYWIVGGSTTQVYSSRVNDFVPTTNIAYNRWLAAGNTATRIDTEASLGQALASYNDMTLQPVAPGVLDGYSDEVAARNVASYINRLFFEFENRIRALEGQTAMTPQQFRQKIKGLV